MNICICGPVCPSYFIDFFDKSINLPSINRSAMAVNTYIKELLLEGNKVYVVTYDVPGSTNDLILQGGNLIIHIVHSNAGLYLSHGLARFYMISRLKKVLELYVNKVDVIHAQWTYDYALAAKKYANRLPVFCTVRDWCPYILSLQTGVRKIQWTLYYLIFRLVMKGDQIQFIANSNYTYDCITKAYPDKNVIIIFNPIDKNLILQERKYQSESITFISIAGSLLEKRKNIMNLLLAFQQFRKKNPESILKLVGGIDNLHPQVIEWKNQGLFENVKFCGYLNQKDLINEIDQSTCLIHPSLEETFGNIFLEGMSRCIPVIGGKDAGAAPQVLSNGKFGMLCDVTSIDSICETMWLILDQDRTRDVVRNATYALTSYYSSDIIVDKHIKYFKFSLNK